MNSDSLAIGLDRLRFYAKDAVLTLTQVSDEGCQKDNLAHDESVHL